MIHRGKKKLYALQYGEWIVGSLQWLLTIFAFGCRLSWVLLQRGESGERRRAKESNSAMPIGRVGIPGAAPRKAMILTCSNRHDEFGIPPYRRIGSEAITCSIPISCNPHLYTRCCNIWLSDIDVGLADRQKGVVDSELHRGDMPDPQEACRTCQSARFDISRSSFHHPFLCSISSIKKKKLNFTNADSFHFIHVQLSPVSPPPLKVKEGAMKVKKKEM